MDKQLVFGPTGYYFQTLKQILRSELFVTKLICLTDGGHSYSLLV